VEVQVIQVANNGRYKLQHGGLHHGNVLPAALFFSLTSTPVWC
jgi:hypothetical protein